MKNLTDKIASIRKSLERAKTEAVKCRAVGDIRKYEEWTDEWRRIDGQLYTFELMLRDAQEQQKGRAA